MRWKTLIWYWLPPLLWMVAITWFSTDTFNSRNTESIIEPVIRYVAPQATPSSIDLINVVIRKVSHFSEYAVLALLWYRAFLGSARWARFKAILASLGIACLWATGDEIHQSWVPSRTPSPLDVALDATGALAAMIVVASKRRS